VGICLIFYGRTFYFVTLLSFKQFRLFVCRCVVTSFTPMTTHLTSSQCNTLAAFDRCGLRSRKTATNQRLPNRRPSKPSSLRRSRRNHLPKNRNHASGFDGQSGDCKASGSCRRKSRPLQGLEKRSMEKVCEEVRRRRRNQRRWKRRKCT